MSVFRYYALMKFFLLSSILCTITCIASAQIINGDSNSIVKPNKPINDISNKLKLYPNPSSNWLFIQHPETAQKGTYIIIIDYTGKPILKIDVKMQTQNTIINLSSLQAGYYVVTWKSEHETGTAKFLKN